VSADFTLLVSPRFRSFIGVLLPGDGDNEGIQIKFVDWRSSLKQF